MLIRWNLIPALLLATLPSLAHAWGGDGHQITCLIAEDRLTPAATAGIHTLLGKGVDISDAEVASWADNIRRQRRDTADYHFVDIPVDAATFDESRDGKDGNNIIDKVGDFEQTIRDPAAKKLDKQEALKFLVHCVGDLHQPLHCADRNDKGGNGRLVFFLSQPRALNLHGVWDGNILSADKGTMRNVTYSDKLNKAITPAEAEEWAKGTPEDWANESHKIAVDYVYKGVPADGPPPKLDLKYVQGGEKIVEQQLKRGGVRLASILNDLFSTPAATQSATATASPSSTTQPSGTYVGPRDGVYHYSASGKKVYEKQ